jgi:hypothetical protein
MFVLSILWHVPATLNKKPEDLLRSLQPSGRHRPGFALEAIRECDTQD